MVCIYCGKSTKVTNSRPGARLPSTWRRRECLTCVAQFSTFETPDFEKSFVVGNATVGYVPFQRDIVFIDIHEALKHRDDAIQAASALTRTVMGKLARSRTAKSSRIEPSEIAKIVFETLKRFDRFAATNYQAFHQHALKPARQAAAA
jgi:transcriptional regulator NrdR family protein